MQARKIEREDSKEKQKHFLICCALLSIFKEPTSKASSFHMSLQMAVAYYSSIIVTFEYFSSL